MEGDPRYDASQDVPDFPYAQFAELIGLKGIRVDHPDDLADAWDEALTADRPVVLEAITDPEVPPLPPHITLEEAKAFTSAIAHGDPHRGRMIRQSMRQKLEEFLPGR
jgi:pyruvate dehydrogenase (quinone)